MHICVFDPVYDYDENGVLKSCKNEKIKEFDEVLDIAMIFYAFSMRNRY
ncbi:MAG: hypothetical protein GX196_09440 [Clostridiaceae bacterium]|nr:hypothetical protein [Clostridiaceae bacterium]